MDLFAVGNDGHVYTAWWYEGQDWSGISPNVRWGGAGMGGGGTAGGNAWRDIGGSFAPGTTISAINRLRTNIDLFAVGRDGQVSTAWWYEGQEWSGLGGWRGLGGEFRPGAHIAVTSHRTTQLDLFGIGRDGHVHTSWWHEGQDWSGLAGWVDLGGNFDSGARVAASARVVDTAVNAGDPLRGHIDLHFEDAVPVGGWAQLVIHPNGTYEFSGHFHDSGWPNYSVAFGWVLFLPDGTTFAFPQSGKVHGTGSAEGSRDYDWVDKGSSPTLRDRWDSVVANGRHKTDVRIDIDDGNLLADLFVAISVLVGVGLRVYFLGRSESVVAEREDTPGEYG